MSLTLRARLGTAGGRWAALALREDLDRNVDVRLPGKGNSNSHVARPFHLTITMIKWIRTSRLSNKNSLSVQEDAGRRREAALALREDLDRSRSVAVQV